MIAPPLRDVVAIGKSSGQVVVRALVYHREANQTVEHNEGELRQVDLVDLLENLLPHSRIGRGLFLDKEFVQSPVAVEVDILAGRRKLVAGEAAGVIRVVRPTVRKLRDVVSASHGSRGW